MEPIRVELVYRGVSSEVVEAADPPTLFVLICIARNFDQASYMEQHNILSAEREYLREFSPAGLDEMERILTCGALDCSGGVHEAYIKLVVWRKVGGPPCDCCAPESAN